eukprot:Opistho-2@91016
MKRQYLYFILITCCLLTSGKQKVNAQDRGAVWVHGFNDNSNQWNNWAGTFTSQRRLNTQSNGSYDSNSGVGYMANLVKNSYGNNNNANRIYFGHSLGGVIGRDIDVNNNGQFGGIITAGSPLDGARIANTLLNGEVANCVVDGVDRVTMGPLAQIGPVAYFVGGIIVNAIPPFLQDVVNSKFGNNQTVNELKENSTYINGIKNNNTITPKVNIYGNEDAPVSWRLASTATNQDITSIVATAGDVYEAAMWVNIGLAASTGWFTLGISAAYFGYVAYKWNVGANWWRYDSEGNWNYLIGSGIPSSNTVCFSQIVWEDPCMPSENASTLEYLSCWQERVYSFCHTYYSTVNGQSDGFIKASSQTGYYSSWASNATQIEAQGVNHLEMSTHETMRDIYNGIFNAHVLCVDT